MLKARLATIKDKAQLLAWANDKETRKRSFMTRRIISLEHDKWFTNVLADQDNQRLFIIENRDTSSCGQVRFSRTDGYDWEIHFSMAAQFRGQKLGAQMIRVGLNAFVDNSQRSRITAKVKTDNVASLRVLAAVGFQIEGKCGSDDSETRLIYISK
jgi:UDP-2,4-diacetamido-2,4,6-trideoxy-beta-L-altropyranose hydrolase